MDHELSRGDLDLQKPSPQCVNNNFVCEHICYVDTRSMCTKPGEQGAVRGRFCPLSSFNPRRQRSVSVLNPEDKWQFPINIYPLTQSSA
jgi:hypothetical protein